MLGIRHFRSQAIDLWQGDSRRFECDLSHEVVLTSDDGADCASFEFGINGAVKEIAGGHIAVSFRLGGGHPPENDLSWGRKATMLMTSLRARLEGLKPRTLRRITFILPSLVLYDHFQQALFAVFPEEDLP